MGTKPHKQSSMSSRYTRFVPRCTTSSPEPNFKLQFGHHSNIKKEYCKTMSLAKVSQESELTPSDFALLHSEWKYYKETVEWIIKTVIEDGKPHLADDKVVKSLCMPVRTISQILCKVYPLNALGFYGLPLFVTASDNSTEASRKWLVDSPNYGDHWVISNTERIWVAWRQESAYFFIVYEKGRDIKKDQFTETLQILTELVANVALAPSPMFNHGNMRKVLNSYQDVDVITQV